MLRQPAFENKGNAYVTSHQSYQLLETTSNSSRTPQYSEITIKELRWRRKIGWYGICVCIVGSVIMFFALAFITFLWKGVDARTSWVDSKLAALWRNIMISGWLTRSVTLSSLVIRTAVAAQAGIFTSMSAALLIERVGVSRFAVSGISVLRNSNTGPHHLVWYLLQELSLRKASIFATMLLLMITTIMSQFTSTALLSDIGRGNILMAPNRSTVAFAQNYIFDDGGEVTTSFWTTKPGSCPTFAEYSELPFEGRDLLDTGATVRAFLPYAGAGDRTVLRSYSGMATILYGRTACIRPTINANIIYNGGTPVLSGIVEGELPIPNFADEHFLGYFKLGSTRGIFNCSLAVDYGRDWVTQKRPRALKEWVTALCRIQDPFDPGNLYGGAFLMLNATKGKSKDLPVQGSTEVTVLPSTKDSPWLTLQTTDNIVTFTATYCYTKSVTTLADVKISTNATNLTEPTFTWDRASNNFNTLAIRNQLGALSTPSSSSNHTQLEDRGILSLSPNWTIIDQTTLNASSFERLILEYTKFSANTTAALCSYCSLVGDHASLNAGTVFAVHRYLVAIFQDILTSTNNPARALQALYHILLQMAYYDSLPEMRITSEVETVSAVEVLMPVAWRGYIAFVAVLFVHHVVAVVVVSWFFMGTKYSMIGNAWMSVGQVCVGETSELVKSVGMMSDVKVRRRVKFEIEHGDHRGGDVQVGLISDETGLGTRVGARSVGR